MPDGVYRYKLANRPPLLYASVYAVLLRHLLGDLHAVGPAEQDWWAAYINRYQQEDGLFRDSVIANTIAEVEDWWGWRHLTLHALMALHALRAKPVYPLRFLEALDTPAKVRTWLGSLDWGGRVDYTSNAVLNYGATLQYACRFLEEPTLQQSIRELLNRVAERCDPKTGLWGRDILDCPIALSRGVQAAYHFWLLYWYEGREIPYPERAFISVTRLQNELGGFGLSRVASSACEDIDALDPLVRLAIHRPQFLSSAMPVVQKGLRWVLSNFNTDGGACFQRGIRFHYGHTEMFTKADQSSLFATWFRMLTVTYCCELLKEHLPRLGPYRFHFFDCPGYQFSPHPQAGRRDPSSRASIA
jgi:hypothetical protein